MVVASEVEELVVVVLGCSLYLDTKAAKLFPR